MIVNFAIPRQEERWMALRVAGVLWLTAAVTSTPGALLPGAHADMRMVAAMTVLEVVWGAFCLLFPWGRIHWDRFGALIFHVPTVASFAFIGGLVAVTGAADSFASYYLFFVVAYVACFFPRSQAGAYVLLAPLVHALPLLYDSPAKHAEIVQQLWGAVPAYLMLGGVIVVGKEQLTRLRDSASTLSLTDPLTALPNRRAFEERIAAHLADPAAARDTGLLLIDLDDFKEANTLYGHPGGDLVLRAAAKALRSAARESDLVARLGGDEFAIVCPGVDSGGMRALAERVLEHVRDAHAELPEELDGFRITASVGWARHPDDGDDVDELMAAADFCLRGVKASGKNASSTPLDWLPEQSLDGEPA